jgi:hypothetical protein
MGVFLRAAHSTRALQPITSKNNVESEAYARLNLPLVRLCDHRRTCLWIQKGGLA